MAGGRALAATVALLGLAGGLGTGAAVDGWGGAPRGAATEASGASLGASEAAAAAAPSVDEAGTAGADGGMGAVGAIERASRGTADVGAAAASAERVEAVAQGVAGDVRPLPVPQLVARDTVGPVWLSDVDRADGLLAVDVAESASGVLDVVPGAAPAPGSAPVRTVRVEVEHGLPVDGTAFAAMVLATLNDPRGWGAQGAVTFERTDGPADVRVVLASPTTVDAMCAPLDTAGQVSCASDGSAVLNFRRWVMATPEFADRHLYRQYVVNHEVGHLLGHSHEPCPGPGRTAPIMQQQSYVVAPCTPNGWPFP